LERASAIIADQDGVQPSDGAVQHWIIKAGPLLADDHAANRPSILDAEVAHFDASGMRVGGKLNGLHVAVTETAVYDTVHPKRGQEAMDAAGLWPHFQGNAVHDHWKSYWSYTHCTHSLCNAHHRRELRYCQELTGHCWPFALRRLLVEGQEAAVAARAAGQTTLESGYVADLLARYDRQVKNGLTAYPVRPPEPGRKGRVKPHEATHLLLRLRDYKTPVWRFLTDWRVPRLGGSTAFCILRSVLETNTLNGINPFDTLRLAFEGR